MGHVLETKEKLLKVFLADSRPWVIAYSGGKDSTLVLQLVYELLLSSPREKLKPVYIIGSDTRVEAPVIYDYMKDSLRKIQKHAESSNIDLSTYLVQPDIKNGFWCNVIGKGYPPPNRWFRWCTTKLKIKPVRKVIDSIVADYGSVILLLGTRKSESASRSRRMNIRLYNIKGLNPHHEIPNALVMQPISEWSTEQVWEYLYTHNPAPWNHSHDEMLALYRLANSGECPVIVDNDSPACGGNRFGCWTCTVVKEDKSMQGFINSGEEWMRPLYDFRNRLKDWREDEELRNKYKRDGRKGIGPFTSDARQMIFDELLKTETLVKRKLISDREIVAIQQQWSGEFDIADTALETAFQYGRQPLTVKNVI